MNPAPSIISFENERKENSLFVLLDGIQNLIKKEGAG